MAMEQDVISEAPSASARKRRGFVRVAVWVAVLIFVIFLAFIAYGFWLVKNDSAGEFGPPQAFTNAGIPVKVGAVDANRLVLPDNPALGSADAPITIVEFSDFECPFCRQAFPIIRSVAKRYTVDVRYVYRHFPVSSLHSGAVAAAEASMCANEQGKFWEYHDRLFLNQPKFSPENLRLYARQAGLDTASFDTCFDSRKYRALVERDLADGQEFGVRGTPTWFINGRKVEGVITEDIFTQLIERVLDGSNR